MRTNIQKLGDIKKAIDKINRFTIGGRDEFYSNDIIQSAVIYQVQIVGEAVYNISGDFKSRYGEIPWKDIEGIRHVLVHGYFEVDVNIIWDVVNKHLPILEKQIADILSCEGDSS